MRDRPLSATLRPTLVEGALRRPRPARPGARRGRLASTSSRCAATGGDVEAVGRLYDALVGPIYRYVAMRLRRREDAEDVTQLVFERIVGGAAALSAQRSAVRGVGVPHRAQRGDRPSATHAADRAAGRDRRADATACGLEALSLRDEEIRELRAAIRSLTPDQQEALALRYGAGLSAEEAARVMGRQAGTVRGLTFRAIESLRRKLAGEARR